MWVQVWGCVHAYVCARFCVIVCGGGGGGVADTVCQASLVCFYVHIVQLDHISYVT